MFWSEPSANTAARNSLVDQGTSSECEGARGIREAHDHNDHSVHPLEDLSDRRYGGACNWNQNMAKVRDSFNSAVPGAFLQDGGLRGPSVLLRPLNWSARHRKQECPTRHQADGDGPKSWNWSMEVKRKRQATQQVTGDWRCNFHNNSNSDLEPCEGR